MKARGWVDEGAVELPEGRRHGIYPPDIARRRRACGLPVTPEEHVAYARGEQREPPITPLEMARTRREVAPRCAPLFAQVLRHIAAQVARPPREVGEEG
ncbi:MAG TPA: hypothetical protein VLK79_12805 [Gaiellales bacterium]|nr:hypothetical protein [Gaiellales bacterium]